MERDRTTLAEQPNPHAPPPPAGRRDALWLPLTLLTAAFVAFVVVAFVRADQPLGAQLLPATPTPTVASANGASLAPNLSDWPASDGCAFDDTVFTARAADAGPIVCLAPTGELDAVDVRIAVRQATGDGDQLAGLVLGETDASHFYTLGVTSGGAVALGQWTSGASGTQYHELRAGASPNPPDAAGWLHLHLIANAHSCFVTVQATVVPLDAINSSAPSSCAFPGGIGVFVAGPNQSAQFAQFALSGA